MAERRMTLLELWGKEFARARVQAGFSSQTALAKVAYVSSSNIGMWETGKRTPKGDDLKRCEEKMETNGYLAVLLDKWVTREVAHEWLDKWRKIEEISTSLWSFQSMVIPALLENDDYARAVLMAGEQPPTNVEQKVAIRLERQKILDEDPPPQLVAVMDESVLHRPYGGYKVMHDQLLRLAELTERPEIIVQIVRMSVGAYTGINGPFVIASVDGKDSMPGKDFAYLDNALSGEVVEHPDQVAIIKRLWMALQGKALDEETSLKLIMEAVKRYEVA
jgi:transcriptional regulator with XRE-family HTH domain